MSVDQKWALILRCDQLLEILLWEGLVKNVCHEDLGSSSHFAILLTEVAVMWMGGACDCKANIRLIHYKRKDIEQIPVLQLYLLSFMVKVNVMRVKITLMSTSKKVLCREVGSKIKFDIGGSPTYVHMITTLHTGDCQLHYKLIKSSCANKRKFENHAKQ